MKTHVKTDVLSLESLLGITRKKLFETIAIFLVLEVLAILADVFYGFRFGYFFPLFVIILYISLPKYFKSLKIRKIERKIPDILLKAAMYPGRDGLERVISAVAREKNYGRVSLEMKKTLEDINKKDFKQAMRNFLERNKSSLVERFTNLMVFAYESGADMRRAFREAAEDIIKTRMIIEERNATMALQKYTVMAAMLIVPTILGLIVRLVNSFSLEGVLFGGFQSNAGLLSAVLIGNYLYIINFSVVSSFYLGFHDGEWKKGFLYLSFLLPISLMIYFFTSS